MNFVDAINAKIARITATADAAKAAIQLKADQDIAILQAVLAKGESWLQNDSDMFYTQLSGVMDKIRS